MLDVPASAEKSHADGKILQRIDDGVGIITFNNPEKRNAMSLDMWEGLGNALIELRDDPDVRVVILFGAGDKAFVSGRRYQPVRKAPAQRRRPRRNIPGRVRRSARCWRISRSR